MKKIENNYLKECYYEDILDNGLKVILYPCRNFKKYFAMLTVKYGSLNQDFYLNDEKDLTKTPAGIAHFLEHKMFEMPNGVDASVMFAELGADVNAYTSYENTTYYFQTVTNFDQSLELLLDFVQTPYFTIDSVESEKGIIEQELMSSLDKPSSIGYRGILSNMFYKNKITEDIGGTIESIKQINADILKSCYDTFYHPSNMYLVVVGNFDLESTYSLIKNNQKTKIFTEYLNPKTVYYLEDARTHKKYDETMMDVSTSYINVGCKFNFEGYSSLEINKLCLLFNFVLDELLASSNYHKWLKEGIIDYSFDFSYAICDKYAYLIINGSTLDEELFVNTIKDTILSIPNTKFCEERFKNFIRSEIGNEIRIFNSTEAIARTINDRELDNIALFNEISQLQQLKYEDLFQINKFINEDSISVFIVKKNA